MTSIHDPIETLPRTRPLTIKKLQLLEIRTMQDLLNYYPTRYENYSLISPIMSLQEGETVTIKGVIKKAQNVYTKRGITLQKVIVEDSTGSVEVTWYNQPYLARIFKAGMNISVAGLVKAFLHTSSIEPREYEILSSPDQKTIHTGRIVPIYPEKKGISTKTLREKIYVSLNLVLAGEGLEEIDWLPEDIRSFNNLIDLVTAYKNVHFPKTMQGAEEARKRLGFDELFIMQLSSALVRAQWKAIPLAKTFIFSKHIEKQVNTFIKSLPFQLTGAQQRATDDILSDLHKSEPMNRFLQGDVGSGKTVVAAIAAYVTHLQGMRTLFMAPTEILALQHFQTVKNLLEPFGLRIGIQTRTKKTKELETYDIVIGTHALLNESVSLKDVGLIIIDEQHRFGVAQRALLKRKGEQPHLLTMTATPIPRTMALTLYGELEMSVIDEMPKGRVPIKTFLVPTTKRNDGYEWIKKEIRSHDIQVFVICPLIEESETETMASIRAATKEYEYLKNTVFTDFSVGMLHGRLSGKEKEEVMNDFKGKKYDILVSTSVVEVGIDIPNATIMVIEGAERFGLAQLHQLRGRVGRGEKQSYCLLFTSTDEKQTSDRLSFFSHTNSGIELAEYDYKIRGPGAIFGTRQHGYLDLKIANFSNHDLIRTVKSAVYYFLNHFNYETLPVVKTKVEAFQVHAIARD